MSSVPTKIQREVAKRSKNRCDYCQSQQRLMGVSLTIDHITPQSLGGSSELDNLCSACWGCNLIKGDRTTGVDPETGESVRLFHPIQQIWSDHFQWGDEGILVVGLTATGRATVATLRLNRPELIESRRYWVTAGWHPPKV